MRDNKAIVTRFAPSPTGRLHLGHAYAALFAFRAAREAGGRFLLRIEDIDQTRCRREYEDGIFDDLRFLGLEWEEPVRRQSEHFDFYRAALDQLSAMGVLYPCFCTRKEIQDEIARAGSAPHGPEGALYPGTCRHMKDAERDEKTAAQLPYALRLDVMRAKDIAGEDLEWEDIARGRFIATPEILGDAVLARKDTPASYHLCVTLDDHLQGVTRVTRGEDLLYATHLHRLVQALLGLDVPEYHHHGLLLDADGKRFAKRNQSVTLHHLRNEAGMSKEDLWRMAGIA